MFNPIISVIIPNYCHAKYLDQRIQSVLNQTYLNFEVIILDDCSPDDGASRAVIEKYRSNPHVTHIVYNEQNSGSTFKQWEKGFNLAKGEYIWIAESDDFCEFSFLESLVTCLRLYPDSSIIQSSTKYVDSIGRELFPKNYTGEIRNFNGIAFVKNYLVNSNYFIPNASAVLFKKEFAKSIPKDYINMVASGDRLFWIYLLEKGDLTLLDLPLNNFRQHNIKVSPMKEREGIQCMENYQINQYLHKKHYISGMIAIREYIFYYQYIKTYNFINEVVRRDLKKLWFPSKWDGNIKLFIYKVINKTYKILTGK